jgi:hypothetical protein
LLEAAVGHLDRVLLGTAAADLKGFTPYDHGEGKARPGLALAVRAVAGVEGKGILAEGILNVAAEAAAALGEDDHGSPEWGDGSE